MINEFLSLASALLAKVPQPLVQPAIDVASTLIRSLVAGDSPSETLRKTNDELIKLQSIQAVYHARAELKFPGYKP